MTVKRPLASWVLCHETKLSVAIHRLEACFVLQISCGNDPSIFEQWGPYTDLGEALREANMYFGNLIERK